MAKKMMIDAWVHPKTMHFLVDRMRTEGNSSVPAVSVCDGTLCRGRIHVENTVDEEDEMCCTVYFKDDMEHDDPDEGIRWEIHRPSWLLEEGDTICMLTLTRVGQRYTVSGTLGFPIKEVDE